METLPGWSWRPQDDRWQGVYDRLLRFVEREGHAFVRQDVIEVGSITMLDSWPLSSGPAMLACRIVTSRARCTWASGSTASTARSTQRAKSP